MKLHRLLTRTRPNHTVTAIAMILFGSLVMSALIWAILTISDSFEDNRLFFCLNLFILFASVSGGLYYVKNKNKIHIVGEWDEDLIWCPSQCYLKIVHKNKWYVLYLRWRHSDPWKAYLCQVEVDSDWDIVEDGSRRGYEWIPLPVDHFKDEEIEQIKANAIEKVMDLWAVKRYKL